jgi:hypothetical protein
MKTVFVGVTALGVLVCSAVRAEERSCKAIDAAIATTFVTCLRHFESPVGLCTEGRIESHGFRAHTRFRALTLETGPAPHLLLYTGELVIKMHHETVTLHDSGMLDLQTGTFFETQVVDSGTHKLKHATGMLTSQGIDVGTGFIGTLTGTICEGGRDDDAAG